MSNDSDSEYFSLSCYICFFSGSEKVWYAGRGCTTQACIFDRVFGEVIYAAFCCFWRTRSVETRPWKLTVRQETGEVHLNMRHTVLAARRDRRSQKG